MPLNINCPFGVRRLVGAFSLHRLVDASQNKLPLDISIFENLTYQKILGILMKQWPHAPLHFFEEQGIYMITAATYQKKLYFKENEELDLLHDLLLELAEKYQWRLEAWAIFPNHYHFMANSPNDPTNLRKFITHLHSSSARMLNSRHKTPGRQVWYQFWDKKITFQSSYLARLNYIIQNPVKHKLVTVASSYPWCSARWFEKNVSKAFYTTVTNVRIDSVNEFDEFDCDDGRRG